MNSSDSVFHSLLPGEFQRQVTDHPIAHKLQKNLLFSILSMMASLASIKEPPVPCDDFNKNEKELIQKVNLNSTLDGERNIQVIRTLATLLQDDLLFEEKQIFMETESSSKILKEDSMTDVRNVIRFRNNDVDDMMKYSSLRTISVNEMLTSITSTGSICVMPTSEDMGGDGIIILPFEGSLCRPSSSVISALNIQKKSDRNRKSGRDIHEKQNMNGCHDTSSGDRIIDMELDPIFAKGISLAYTDTDTPKGYITVLTVAYHTTDFKTVVDHSSRSSNGSNSSSSGSNSSSSAVENSSANFTHNAYPSLQIRIPDSHYRIYPEPFPLILIPESTLQSADVQRGFDQDSNYSGTGECRGETRQGEKGEHWVPPLVYARDVACRVGAPVDAVERTMTTSIIYPMTSDTNKAEGGLFGFITEEISIFLIRIFRQARKEVHKQEAKNILFRNCFPKNLYSKSTKKDSRSTKNNVDNVTNYRDHGAENDNVDSAWVDTEELKKLLLFFIDQSSSTPLPFLNFLHDSMILFGRSASIFDYRLSSNAGAPNNSIERTFFELTDGKEDGMMTLMKNLLKAFGHQCYCFLDDSDDNSNKNNVERMSSSHPPDNQIINDTLGMKQNIAPKGSNFHIIICQSELPDTVGFTESNIAMHICIPLRMPFSFSDPVLPYSKIENIEGNTKFEKKSKLKISLRSVSSKKADISDTIRSSFFHLIESANDTSNKKKDEVIQSYIDNRQKCKEKFIGQIVDIVLFTISEIL